MYRQEASPWTPVDSTILLPPEGVAVSARQPPKVVYLAREFDHDVGWSCDHDRWSSPDGDIAVLRVSGEIDLATRPVLHAELASALDRTPAHLVVDLAGVTFCCVRGFALLANTSVAATATGTGYALSGLPPTLERQARKLWADYPTLQRYPTAAQAAAALHAEQAGRSA